MAAALFLLREGLVEMDVPTRQSYVLAVVEPTERTFVSGITTLVRLAAWSVAPGFAGLLMTGDTMFLPLGVGAAMKIAYDILLWRVSCHSAAGGARMMRRMARKRGAKNGTQSPSTGARWVLFMPTIPAKPASVRVKIWRRLQAIGAVGLRGSVYALPNREECVEVFEWVSRELREQGGQASICEGRFLDGSTDDDIERRFIDARNADYAEIADAAKALAKKLEGKRLAPERIREVTEQHAKLVARFGEVTAIDFLHVPGREAVEGLLAAVARALPRDGAKASAPLEVIDKPRGATWVTRTGVHVDRIASAWLIRRFIDSHATLKFVPAKGYVPKSGELRFDMFEAEFTHVGDRCTFEVLVERMGLRDPALTAIGEIIHDLDLHDDKFAREETAGIRSTIDGICTVAHDDEQRIAAASPMFDGLYSHFSLRSRRRATSAKPTRA